MFNRMPALFVGHGSPMNAIEDNRFTHALRLMGEQLPKPKAIICISAHWLTRGLFVTESEKPRMIYDMYGFPEELYRINYPAAGSREVVLRLKSMGQKLDIQGDDGAWGFDHGTWSILKLLYPEADIPTVQLSIDASKAAVFQFEVGKLLSDIRDEGVMIIGSGNIVHNLRNVSWEPDEKPFPWAIEFESWVKSKIETRNFLSLVNGYNSSETGRMSVPTTDHYFPLLAILGAARQDDPLCFPVEGIQNGSISMLSVKFG